MICVDIDRSPIGRAAEVETGQAYTGIFTAVRDFFAGTPGSAVTRLSGRSFSFNVKGGRCEACQGDGVLKVEIRQFLPGICCQCLVMFVTANVITRKF